MVDSYRDYAADAAQRSLLFLLKALITTFVLFAPFLIAVLGPRLVAAAGRSLGWTLKKKTDGRRSHLINLMDEENKKSNEKDIESKSSSSSGEWQKVQQTDLGATNGAEKADQEWDGIVGFFHPFW